MPAAGDNDTGDGARIRILGAEQRIGSNCHHYREVVRKISAQKSTDYSNPVGGCECNPETDNPCTVSTTRSFAVTVGFTGGFSAKAVKAELPMSEEESVAVQIACGTPKDPQSSRGTMAYLTSYSPTYTIEKYYVQGGGIAERSAVQEGRQGLYVVCRTIQS